MSSGRAASLAQQVIRKPDDYPAAVFQAAVMLLLDPDSGEMRGFFLDLYDQASAMKSVLASSALPFPPDQASYYEPGELLQPGVEIGVEPVTGWTLKLFVEHLGRHFVVAGMTGSGKTNLLQALARGLASLRLPISQAPAVIVFDRHGNFRGLQEEPGQNWLVIKARECRFALFDPVTPGFPRAVQNMLCENRGLIKSQNVIADAHARIVEALNDLRAAPSCPTLEHIDQALKCLEFPDTKRDYVLSALTELEDMLRSVGCIWNCGASDMMEKLLAPGMHTVIDTADPDNNEELGLVTWMLRYSIDTGNVRPRTHHVFFIIDELQPLFRKRWDDQRALQTLKTSVLTARQPHVGIIGGLQVPAEVEPELLASAGTLITTGLQDRQNVEVVASAMGIPREAAQELFQSLEINEAIYKFADRPGPFRIEMPLSGVSRQCDEARREQKVRQFRQNCNVQAGPPWEEVLAAIERRRKASPSKPDASELGLLRAAADTCASPLPLSSLASRAGLPGPEGSRASKSLEKRGLARREPVLIGRTRMVFAEPTDEGFRLLGMTPPTGIGRGGCGHRYCLSQVEKKLQDMGYTTQREVEMGGKRIDLVGRKGSSRVFVEAEMSDKNAARNAAADHAVADASVKQILVLCPSARVLKAVQKAVQSALDAGALKRFAFKLVTDL
jgi:hypothetical protein